MNAFDYVWVAVGTLAGFAAVSLLAGIVYWVWRWGKPTR